MRKVGIKKFMVALLFGLNFSYGQDIHFSQYDGSLLNLNPALTGFFNGDYRVGAIYRSQWQAVPVPYSTISMSGETRMKPIMEKKDAVGIGLLFNNDVAGDARYGSTQLYLSGSYIYNAREDSSLLFSLGLNIGYCSVGFDYNRMTFDNQFDGLNFNKSVSTGENFQWTRYNYGDFNLGLATQYSFDKYRILYGISAHHLTSPVISYQGNDLSRLDFRLSNYARFVMPVTLNDDLITELLYSRQGKYNELIPHVSIKHYMHKDANKAILGGLCFRAKDAVILRMGYTHKNFQGGIAYDINISKFTAATNRRGAFEIFVSQILFKKYQTVIKNKPCPVFM